MNEKLDEADPILSIIKSREEEAKKNAEMLAEIAKKKIESDKRIMSSRIAANAEIQKKRKDSWPK